MSKSKIGLIAPVLLISCGVAWLLSVTNVAPQIDWVWVIGLLAVGFLLMLVLGVDKVTVIVGPFLFLSAAFTVLLQTDLLGSELAFPLLVIALGVLLLIARCGCVPSPRWIMSDDAPNELADDDGQ